MNEDADAPRYEVRATFRDGLGIDGAKVDVGAVSSSQLAVCDYLMVRWDGPFPKDGDRHELVITFADDHSLEPIAWEVVGVSSEQVAALRFELHRAADMLRDAILNAERVGAFDRGKLRGLVAAQTVPESLKARH